MTPTVQEIDDEIARLSKVRRDLTRERDDAELHRIQGLEWTKDCDLTVQLQLPLGYGNPYPRYTLLPTGMAPYLPPSSASNSIVVMGNHTDNSKNMFYGHLYSGNWVTAVSSPGPCVFYTSSVEMVTEFLAKVKFKKVMFNADHLAVLKAAEAANA